MVLTFLVKNIFMANLQVDLILTELMFILKRVLKN